MKQEVFIHSRETTGVIHVWHASKFNVQTMSNDDLKRDGTNVLYIIDIITSCILVLYSKCDEENACSRDLSISCKACLPEK